MRQQFFFFTRGSPFSNFHAATVAEDRVPYVNAKQHIQAKKAELFNDDETHLKIIQSTRPYELKRLGSRFKNFDKQTWENQATSRQIAQDACIAKFHQHLKNTFLETGDKMIGETSTDQFWGIGKTLNGASVFGKDYWSNNLLGKVLMAVREQLK